LIEDLNVACDGTPGKHFLLHTSQTVGGDDRTFIRYIVCSQVDLPMIERYTGVHEACSAFPGEHPACVLLLKVLSQVQVCCWAGLLHTLRELRILKGSSLVVSFLICCRQKS
jgi:hypothetical protein